MVRRLILHTLWIATALGILVPSAVDPDLWGHLLFGNLLLAGTIPEANGLAYTALTHPWLNHEILAEAALAAVFNSLGARGLVVLKTVIGLASLLLVWRAARRRSHGSWAAAIATAVAAFVMAPGFMIRPQLFTLFFLALTLDVLSAARYRAHGRAWYLPALAVLWVNTHGGVLAGVGLAAIAVVATLAARARHGVLSAREVRATALWLAALGAALVVNPYGPRLLHFLLTGVTPPVPITEWAPVVLGDTSFALFKAMLVVTIAWLAIAGRARAPEIAIVCAAALAALMHRRHIPLFAIAAAPVLAACLADVARRLRQQPELAATQRLARGGLAVAAVMQLVLAVLVIGKSGVRIDVDPRTYPVQAMRFLDQNAISGNVALPFDWGEFALWSLAPESKVAVDGRFTTAYPTEVLAEAWRFMTGGDGWDDLLTRHPTDIVVAARSHPSASGLRGHPEWEYVYSDAVSLIFLRKVPSQAEALQRFHTTGFYYDRAPLDVDFPASIRGTPPSERVREAATASVPAKVSMKDAGSRAGAGTRADVSAQQLDAPSSSSARVPTHG